MFKKIICPVEGSTPSNQGLALAINLAYYFNASLCLLHVVDTYYPIMGSSGDYMSVNTANIIRENGKEVIKESKQQAQKTLDLETKLIETLGGNVADSILTEASNWHADLIVMRSRGIRGLKKVVMGSDAEHVIRTSSVPVLISNEKKEEKLLYDIKV